MPKIVVTEKYSESFQTQISDGKPPLTTKSLSAARDNLRSFCERINVDPSEIIASSTPVNKSLYKREAYLDATHKLEEIPELFGQSLNRILHEVSPQDYPLKNSKFSNFKISNVLSLKKEHSQNILILLKRSVSQRMMCQSKVVANLQKANSNWSKFNTKSLQINEKLKKALSLKRLGDDKVPNWTELTREYYESTEPENMGLDKTTPLLPRMSRLLPRRPEDKDRSGALRLMAKYERQWKKSKDYSVRQVELTTVPFLNKDAHSNKKI